MIELIGDVNLEKYMGTWLEMARKPAFFQKSCVQSKAEYQLEYEGSTSVVNIKNICVKKDGEVSQVQGKAKVKSPRALSVKFSIFMNLFNKTSIFAKKCTCIAKLLISWAYLTPKMRVFHYKTHYLCPRFDF